MRDKVKIKYHDKEKNKRHKVKILISLIIISIIIILIYFFIKSDYKNLEFGNNMSNKNIEEIEEYILNISSYDAKIEVTIESNKNTNRYKIIQRFSSPNIAKQVIEEPSNIAGLETIYDGNKLTINNSKLNASTIYENYQYMIDNFLWLNSFIEDYKTGKSNGQTKLEEKDGNIIMEAKVQNKDNKYIYNKKLYIDRKTGKPTKLLVQDINKKNLVYILYNEITVNGLQREEVLAFKLKNVYSKVF